MSDDHDLRSRLERIASSAGDPPEHGLERVAARRHRRLRRRRGAVVTAAALAVLLAAAPLISRGLDDDRESVTASETASPTGAPAELPRIVELRCEPTGIVVPVASVRPQRDGLHLRVVNLLGVPTEVRVESDDWESGAITVGDGITEVRQPVPPGVLTIGCEITGRLEQRRVDLVDPSGYYERPELACDEAEQVTLRDLVIEPAAGALVPAVRQGLAAYLLPGDALGPIRGYPGQRLTDPTADPVVQVVRQDEVIAFAHVRGVDGATSPPWSSIVRTEGCAAALTPTAEPPATTGTTSVPPASATPPPA
jgi:hypothetical protein